LITDFCIAETPSKRVARIERQLGALAEHEATIRAFVCYDPSAALRHDGPLAATLIGVKDVIATANYPTCYGMAEDVGPREDAWCVARLQQLGATLLGKTVCTAFGYPLPGPTTNPHDAARTPGGSSSGSAAAVAAGFVSFAIGTQTAGSTIRPASYCGVVGFKPSYGLLPLEGVQAIAPTLDHLGVFAVSPRDVWYFVSAMVMPRAEVVTGRRPNRLLVLRLPPQLPLADEYAARIEEASARLQGAGVQIATLDLPVPIADFHNLQKELCYWEAARTILPPCRVRPVPALEALLVRYRDSDLTNYAAARRRRQEYQAQFDSLAAEYDAVLLPAATGVAPMISDTGDAVMSRFWTALHVPAISLPVFCNDQGLPLGLQLLGRLGMDRSLIETSQWIFERLRNQGLSVSGAVMKMTAAKMPDV
jgi:amidase